MIHTTYGHVLREMEDKIIDTFDSAIEIGAKIGAISKRQPLNPYLS